VTDDTFSDHKKISFTIKSDKRPPWCNVKQTDWGTYQAELSAEIGLWIGSLNTPADIERELNKLNSAIISSFEKACLARKCSGRNKVPRWNHELRCLRQQANKAFIRLTGLVTIRIATNTVRLEELSREHFDAINDKNGVISVHVQKDSTKS